MFLLTFAVHALDQGGIDSLKSVIETTEHDTSVCDTYLRWGEEVYIANPDTALILWQKAYDIAKKNLPNGQSVPLPALEKKYLSSLADALNNIGYIYQSQGDIQKGLKYYFKALKIDEELGNKNGVATSLNNIGAIYKNQGDIQMGLEYYFKSLKI